MDSSATQYNTIFAVAITNFVHIQKYSSRVYSVILDIISTQLNTVKLIQLCHKNTLINKVLLDI